MTDLRRALTNSIRLLEREAGLRKLSIEGGAQEFEEDARLLKGHLDLLRHHAIELAEDELVAVEIDIEDVIVNATRRQCEDEP